MTTSMNAPVATTAPAQEDIEFTEDDPEDYPEDGKTEEGEFSTTDDFAGQWIKSPKVGDTIDLEIKGFRKVARDKCSFEYKDPVDGRMKRANSALSNVDYGVEAVTMDGKSWMMNIMAETST